jgi:predicted ferric reductase
MTVNERSRPGAAAAAINPAVLIALAVPAGVALALMIMPRWLPGLSASLLDAEPKGCWYVSRATAFVAYLLMWGSMIFGLLMTSKTARLWPGGPAALDLHRHTSLLGLGFAAVHALVLLGDRYMNLAPAQVLIPFAMESYRPIEVALGQTAIYAGGMIAGSFYIRSRIGTKAWRAIHFASFAIFILVLAHGLLSGTDSTTPWAQAIYWFTGGSVLFLTIYRVLAARIARGGRAAQPAVGQ